MEAIKILCPRRMRLVLRSLKMEARDRIQGISAPLRNVSFVLRQCLMGLDV